MCRGAWGKIELAHVRDCVVAVAAGPASCRRRNGALEQFDTLNKSCDLGVKGVQLYLLLMFNSRWCVPPNVVSHRSQVNGVLAVQSMGANTSDLGDIRALCDLAMVLLEGTTMAAGR
jgi:hypothetical protein